MSNVYKYYVPQGKTDQTRVIGASAEAEERLRQRIAEADEIERQRRAMRQAEESGGDAEGSEEAGGEFVEGLFAEAVDPDSGEIVGEVPEEAEAAAEPPETEMPPQSSEQAEALLAAAKEQAEEILAEAAEQAEQLRANASEQGYQEGLENGRAAAEQEAANRMHELEELKSSMETEREDTLRELEPQLLDVILQVFNRVFHIQFDDKKEILEYLVTNTIMNVEGSREFRIKTSEDNFPYISSHLGEIRSQVGQEYNLEVIADSSIGENKCVIETDSGFFDCSIDVHLENLTKDLKSLAP